MQKPTAILTLFSFNFLLSLSCSDSNKTPDRIPTPGDEAIREKTAVYREELKGDYLIGTTVMDGSPLNLESRWVYGLSLDSLSSSECSPPASESPAPARITGVSQPDDSTLLITASIEENCSFSFLGEIQISGNTINVIYLLYGGGGMAACSCCFGLTYKIRLVKDEEYRFDKLKFVSINGYAKIKLPRLIY